MTALLRKPRPADDTDALLQEILAELHALHADVAALKVQPGRVLSDGDRAALEPLLPAVFTLLGDRVWTVAVLVHLAATDEALAAGVEPFLVTPGGLRRLGKLLRRRADGQLIAGFAVQRVGAERTGALWRVSKAQETHETRSPDSDCPPRAVSS